MLRGRLTAGFIVAALAPGLLAVKLLGASASAAPVGAFVQCLTGAASHGACRHVRAMQRPAAVAFSANGRFAYVAAEGSASVVVLAHQRDGTFRQPRGALGCIQRSGRRGCRRAPTLIGTPQAVVLSPDASNVYVVGSSIATFKRNPQDGGLSPVAAPEGCLAPQSRGGCRSLRGVLPDSDPRRIADEGIADSMQMSPNGRDLYIASDTLLLLHRDPTGGLLVQADGTLGCTGRGFPGCASGVSAAVVRLLSDGHALAFFGAHFGEFPLDPSSGALGDPVFGTGIPNLGLLEDLAVVPRSDQIYALIGSAIVELRPRGDALELHRVTGKNGCVAPPERERLPSPGSPSDFDCQIVPGIGCPYNLAISADGRQIFLAAHCRRPHLLVAFERNAITGVLRYLWRVPVGGDFSRALTVSPDDCHVFDAAQGETGELLILTTPGNCQS